MKLKRVRYKNFKLLRDVEINFSTDSEKKLTVIRADNGTGKTTALNGLIWGLYGSRVITEKLYPINLFEVGHTRFEISVEIDFSTDNVVTKDQRRAVSERSYRLIRSCTEKVSSDKSVSRTSDKYSLYELTDEGYRPIENQSERDNIIERSLPEHLKDIYFTDGDKALTFIESSATKSEKRSRVKRAIESLLSMKELDSIIKNLKAVKLAYARKIDNNNYSEKLIEAETRLGDLEDFLSDSDSEISDFEEEYQKCENDIISYKKKIEEQLRLGNKEALSQEIISLRNKVKRDQNLKDNSVRNLCSLLNDSDISASLIYESLTPAIKLLEEKDRRDSFPKQFIPVLKDVLNRDKCLCGSDISNNTEVGRKNRSSMLGVIDSCQEVDLLNAKAMNLFYAGDKYTPRGKGWLESFGNSTEQYFGSDKNIRESKVTLQKKQAIVDALKDDELIILRTNERIVTAKAREISGELAVLKDERNRSKQRIPGLKKEVEVNSNRVGKNNTSGGKHALTSETLKVFEGVFERIKTTELKKVSSEMNNIFMSMIASGDVFDGAGVIQSCELTDQFDIKVYGPHRQSLDPDTELNGASRRAISLSFILALTKVSNVVAANVIDTPLGMTSGLVKSSILRNLVEQGSQIIMFLTFDEIKGVEDLIDKYAGKVVTLTFSGHYPMMLKNKQLNERETTICDCSHRQCCKICERLDQVNLEFRN
jgi:DNA sulfur modification protein DndD